ncbi:MAG: hypothetical protein M1480_02965 [Bacteroidetes bacterium]|nr:hypothetical protein [Bacteroidota bacterium]
MFFEIGYNKKVFIKLLAFVFQSCIAVLGGGLKTTPLVRQAKLDASYRVKVFIG